MSDRYSVSKAVVTGGAQGIGAAIAQRLAADGLSVTVLDVKPPTGPHDRYLEVDLADEKAVDAAINEITGPVSTSRW